MKCYSMLSGLVVTACGWPEGLPSDSSYTEDSASGGSSTTTTSSDAPESTGVGSGTTTSGANDSSSTDEGPAFIQDPDGGSRNLECDLWQNDCPPGEKCMPWAHDGGSSWNATKCSPLARDPGAPGEPCTVVGSGVSGVDDCEAFAMCWDIDSRTHTGVCVAFCRGSEANPICEDPGLQCTITGAGVLIICLPSCDPLLQDCAEGQGCYPSNEYFSCADDLSGSAGAAGDPCEFLNVCDPGIFCANAGTVPACEAAGCCTPFCDLGARPPVCPLLTECVPWYENGQAPPGFDDVGGCMVAM